MKEEEKSEEIFRKLSLSNNINNFQNFIFAFILFGFIILYNINYYFFHSLVEAYSCIVAGGILMISVSTYHLTKNNYFLFLGIGFLCVLILDLLHAFTFVEVFKEGYFYDMETRFWVAARGLELLTFLLSFKYLINPKKTFNPYLVILVYFTVTLILTLDIFQYNFLIPTTRIEGIGITKFKINFEYFVAAGYVICCGTLFITRKKIDKSLFIYLEISFMCKIISGLFFTMYLSVYDIYNMLGHIFKVMSFYLIYMGIIVNGFQRPFDMIKFDLGNKLRDKENQRLYMEEIIHNNEQCYEWVINNSSNGIIIVRNMKIVYANKTVINMLGAKDIIDVAGRDFKDFIFDNSINFNELIKNSNSQKFNEMSILRLNKEILDVEYSINHITHRGTPAHLILLKDIRFIKEINKLKNNLLENKNELVKSNEYNKVLTEFFSNISHDLKTPINVILSAVQLLYVKKTENNPEEFNIQLNRLLGIIKQNCFRLIRLVSNLIDISKVESGFLKLELKNQNIVNIVEDITLSVGDYIRSKGVNVIFDTDIEERIMAVDEDKIERVILNLLSNAVKFTDKGDEILVNLTDGENLIKISVKDTGIGIPEEKLKFIFNRFAQVEDTLIKNREGSGIGLSLVRTLTEMHGGKVKVISSPGKGSEFIIELPIILTDNEEEYYEIRKNDNKIDRVLIEFSDIYSIDS